MSRPGTVVKLVQHRMSRPRPRTIHDVGGLIAGISERAEEIVQFAEAAGSGLYRLVPVDMEFERRLDDRQEMV